MINDKMHSESVNLGSNEDTIIINKDSTSGEFCYVMNYKSEKNLTEIYRERDIDRELDFTFEYNFKNAALDYRCFLVYDEPTGVKWSFLFYNKRKALYKTDRYDDKAIGDQLIKNSVNFNDKTIIIKSDVDKREYKINLVLVKKISIN